MLINTHVVKTEADFEFWRDVQCREKLYVGNENGEIIDVGETLREAKVTLGEMKEKMVNLSSRSCETPLALCDYVVEDGYVFPTPIAATTFSTTKSSSAESSS